MLGIAQGVIGMSREDFCAATPEQFYEIHLAFSKQHEADMRSEWERVRAQSSWTLQPYSKGILKPTDVATFKWDSAPAAGKIIERGTKEDFERARKMYGV